MNVLKSACAALALGALAASSMAPAGAAPAKRPNILLIVADDLGYNDIGSFGSEIGTPNLDKLATGGVRLTSYYTTPFCSPTRSILMSGTDNHLAGFGDMAELMTKDVQGKPGYEGRLNDRVVPLPQVLHDAGYRTLMAGKWHLGNNENINSRGFDRSFAQMSGGASHWGDQLGIVAFDPAKPPRADYREDGQSIALPKDFYSSDAYASKIIEYLDQTKGSGKPFFAYLAFTAPHWPLAAPEEDIKKYENRYGGGYDALRKERLASMKAKGIVAKDSTLYAGHSYWPKWDTLPPDQQRSEAKRMAVYAAMVDRMDQQIGRVLRYLEQQGELDNTFVFFMSDNGADGNSVYDVERNREWVHGSMDNSTENIGKPGSFVEYGPGWAQAGMTPFRMYKSFMYEGGISATAIAWSPKLGIAAGVKGAPIHVKDLAPTLYEIAGTKHPGTEYQGKAVLPVTGKSMLGYLTGKQSFVHDANKAMGWELGGRKALRKGDWKIVYSNKPWGTGEWELYNLANDRAETHDLAAKHPEKLKELVAEWPRYVAGNGVIEIDNLAARPGYSNAGKYYEDLKLEAASKPRAAK